MEVKGWRLPRIGGPKTKESELAEALQPQAPPLDGDPHGEVAARRGELAHPPPNGQLVAVGVRQGRMLTHA